MARDNQAHPPLLDDEDAKLGAVVQLLLAEKRTSLAVLRTGVTVGLVPLSITTVLVTVSRFYSWIDNLHFLVPMYAVMTVLALVSVYLVIRSLRRIAQQDRAIDDLRRDNPGLGRFIR
jgi:hypothetical protein